MTAGPARAATLPAMSRSGLGRGRRRPKGGLSVVEVLVALVVVAVGLLAIAGSSALAVRASSAADRERAAASRAERRLAFLQAGGCGTAASGSATGLADGARESWSVGPQGAGFVPVELRVEWVGRGAPAGGIRRLTLAGAIRC